MLPKVYPFWLTWIYNKGFFPQTDNTSSCLIINLTISCLDDISPSSLEYDWCHSTFRFRLSPFLAPSTLYNYNVAFCKEEVWWVGEGREATRTLIHDHLRSGTNSLTRFTPICSLVFTCMVLHFLCWIKNIAVGTRWEFLLSNCQFNLFGSILISLV